jgi:HSP20 family protein
MYLRWSDLDREFAALEQFRRRMDSLYNQLDVGRAARPGRAGTSPLEFTGTWPPINLYDGENHYRVEAALPGISGKDLKLTATQDVLTLSGERQSELPEGYNVHRRERSAVNFSRSFTLPGRIDPEKVKADLKNGILTVTLEKAPETRPKRITVGKGGGK